MMILAYNSTNATMSLQYNKSYDIILYATSCGASVNIDSTSINLTLPEYDGMRQYNWYSWYDMQVPNQFWVSAIQIHSLQLPCVRVSWGLPGLVIKDNNR